MTYRIIATAGRRKTLFRSLCILWASVFSAAQSLPATKPVARPPLLLGAAWYPEQWPESRWNADLDLMEKAHIYMVRLGEFAWSRIEPREGMYDLNWMERAIDLAGKHGIYVVIGTPSCAPPAWLIQKYPQARRTLEDGSYATPGKAGEFNWNSGEYRRLVRLVDIELAKRFGHNPYVIGWQIDNEFNNPSFDAVTRAHFQRWLKARYGTLDALNNAWTTNYHSLTYSSWDQIPIVTAGGDPGLMLDWKRFVTDTYRSYQKNQLDAIRSYASPSQKITTNMTGWTVGYDHYIVSRDLDFAAWDDPLGGFDPIGNGAKHDLTRGFKNKNFWVMETTAGPSNGSNLMLPPGEMRAAMWHDVGHGADAVSYWQWRDALNGDEQNHGAIVDVDGKPDPIFSEIAQVGREFELAGPVFEGTSVHARIAILHSYESRWSLSWQRVAANQDSVQELLRYYAQLHKLGYTIDIVSPDDDLSRYSLVLAPGLNLIAKSTAQNLRAYVENGGTLILGQRSGMKDDHNSRWPQRQPGPLAQMLGARVEQYFDSQAPIAVSGAWGVSHASAYAESLTQQMADAKVLIRYDAPGTWLDKQPAAIMRKAGKGTIAYIGAWLDDDGTKQATEWMLATSGVAPDLPLVPEGVEVYRRSGGGKEVFIFDNFSNASQSIKLTRAMKDVLTGREVRSLSLDVYGVAVLVVEDP